MGPVRSTIIALLVLGVAAAAQGSVSSLGGPADEQAPRPIVDVSRLPLDLDRVQRGLRQSSIREEREGLNLRYIIEVFGQAPPFVFFTKEDNLLSGPVPHGAPTHREMLEHVTPREYRAPAADIGALIRWLADKSR